MPFVDIYTQEHLHLEDRNYGPISVDFATLFEEILIRFERIQYDYDFTEDTE